MAMTSDADRVPGIEMPYGRAVQPAHAGDSATLLYDRIGAFLFDQRLEPNPVNYAFAYQLIADPDGPLSREVDALTEGGIRLTQRDIEQLGAMIDPKRATARPAAARAIAAVVSTPQPDPVDPAARADGLVAATQLQVEGFADMVQSIHAQTRGFGRDLAASAQALRLVPTGTARGDMPVAEIARVTGIMLERVHAAETRLENTTREASELRAKLAEARSNARHDPLTGLPNRRAVEEEFVTQLASGGMLCLAVCDIDHFKSVNDRFGHSVGDRVLKAIGGSLVASCDGHLVARYGGEEFAILFTDLGIADAFGLLDDARLAVAAKRFRLRETAAPVGEVTFSAGIVAVGKAECFAAAFERADALLYAAKSAGRNMVTGHAR